MEQLNYNPMLNDVILDKIFEMLPLSDLASCSQVCKTWRKHSLKRWPRDMWLKLYEDDHSDENGSIANFTGLTLESFLLKLNDKKVSDVSPNLKMRTFKKFTLHGWNFNSEDNEFQNQFWKTCGPLITGLRIERSTFHSRVAFESVVFQDLPNLEELILFNNYYSVEREQRFEALPRISFHHLLVDETSFYDALSRAKNSNVRNLQVILYSEEGSEPKFPLSFLEFIANFRNLKSLTLSGLCEYHSGSGMTFESFLNAMLTLSRNGEYRWAVENLDILNLHKKKIMYSSHTFRLLEKLDFPLSSLTLDIGSYTEPSYFKRILEIYANTLRKLVVYREDGYVPRPDLSLQNFPFEVQLNSLTDLRLLGTAVTPNLHFFQYAPNLRSVFLVHDAGTSMLNIGSLLSDHDLFTTLRNRQSQNTWRDNSPGACPVRNTDFTQLQNTILPNMEEFILCGKHDRICSREQVTALARLMPNLKKVRLGLDNDGFWSVCSAWKELELLIIQPCDVKNSGITGTIPGIQTQLPNLNNLTR
ncbi:unnamed protein product [Orchesella dallaii]|uniref:F-box domain-containing protein n=1 Tax=Orchesella dallaii TaxID=48710 RepID=A0ABP1PSF0_9HEXA